MAYQYKEKKWKSISNLLGLLKWIDEERINPVLAKYCEKPIIKATQL